MIERTMPNPLHEPLATLFAGLVEEPDGPGAWMVHAADQGQRTVANPDDRRW